MTSRVVGIAAVAGVSLVCSTCLWHRAVESPALAIEATVLEDGRPAGERRLLAIAGQVEDYRLINALYVEESGYSGTVRIDTSTSDSGRVRFTVPKEVEYRGNMFPLPVPSDWHRTLLLAPGWPSGPVYRIRLTPRTSAIDRLNRTERVFVALAECESIHAQVGAVPSDEVTVLSVEVVIDRTAGCEYADA